MSIDGAADGTGERAADSDSLKRRALIKAAVGAGVALAAHSAPKVSVVPAYGLTTSRSTDNRCYSFAWSGNNPNGKGWMLLGDQPSTAAAQRVRGPNLKASNNPTPANTTGCGNGTWTNTATSHSGTASCTDACVGNAPAKGPVRYTWTIQGFGSLGTGTFNVSLILTGSANFGGTNIEVEGLPAGYCVRFYNNGRGNKAAPGSSTNCGYTNSLQAAGAGQVTMTSRTTGFLSPIKANPANNVTCSTGGEGKWWWHFNVEPCPPGVNTFWA